MIRSRKTRAMAVVMTLALAAGTATIAPDSFALTKPSLSSSGVTVNVGKTKKVTIKKGSYTIQDVDVDVKNDDLVDVDWNHSKITIEGEKAGKTTMTTTIKAKYKKKKTKTFKIKTKITVKKAASTPTPAPATPVPVAPTVAPTVNPSSGDVKVYTQADLDAALAGGKTSITIEGNTLTYASIATGNYRNVDLTINAPNADITNSATFKSVTINAVKNVYTEYADGNSITLADTNKVNLVVQSNGTLPAINVIGKVTTTNEVHVIEVKSGNVTSLTLAAGTKASVTTTNQSTVGTLNCGDGAYLDLRSYNASQVGTLAVAGAPQISINGSSTRLMTINTVAANANARIYINAAVVDRVNSASTVSADQIVANRTSAPIKNYIDNNVNPTYILPQSSSKSVISISVSTVNPGDSYVDFRLVSPTGLDITQSGFDFYIRSGSKTGTIMNNDRRAVVDGSAPYYTLSTNSGLSTGTYYITLGTNQNYDLATTSFVVSDGLNFSKNNLTAGTKIGNTKLTGMTLSGLGYLVDNNSTVQYPRYASWTPVPSDGQIAIQKDQYLHLCKLTSYITNVATVRVDDASKIKGEAQRIEAANKIAVVINDVDMNGNYTSRYLNTRQRWYQVDKMIDAAVDAINAYSNAGAGQAELYALPHAAEFQTYSGQFYNTIDKLIVDITIPQSGSFINVGSKTKDQVIQYLKDNFAGPYTAKNGDGDYVAVTITAWKVFGSYDSSPGASNYFQIGGYTTDAGSDVVIAQDLMQDIGIHTVNDELYGEG